MNTFVLGDVHGNYRALKQVIERCGIDKENDLLITLGDIVDGFPETFECVEELLTFKNRIDIRGNHDDWFVTWLNTGSHPDHWMQGGEPTARSYAEHVDYRKVKLDHKMGGLITDLTYIDIPQTHRDFFHGQRLYYKDENNNVFVHGGFYRWKPLKGQNRNVYLWDRDMTADALNTHGDPFTFVEEVNEVFIGHTPTPYIDKHGNLEPIHAQNVWNLDTGAGGRRGKLTILRLEDHQYWQSDIGGDLYPDGGGRNF